MPTCTATTTAGNPCRASATETGLCPLHGATPAERSERGRLAVQARRKATGEPPLVQDDTLPVLATSADVELFLTRVISEVRAGTMPPPRAVAINALLATRTKQIAADLMGEIKALRRAWAATKKCPACQRLRVGLHAGGAA